MRHQILKIILITILTTPFACSYADTPTGQDLVKILLKNKDQIIQNKDGWCTISANKPLSAEIVRVLSPNSKFEDNIQEELHYQCSESMHELNSKEKAVWQCQIGVVETNNKEKEYFTSRSIFFAVDKKSDRMYMDSIRCMN